MRAREFVALLALTLISGAMATDLLVPAVRRIDRDIVAIGESSGRMALIAFLFGVGCLQCFFGPLADRLGRRPIFLMGTALFVFGALLVSQASDANWLVLARWTQGVGTGAMRVAIYAVARDRCHDGGLARLFSLAMALLLLEPIVAPVLGQYLLDVGSWRDSSNLLALIGLVVLVWSGARLDESQPRPCACAETQLSAFHAYRRILRHRPALGSMLAYGMVTGAHVGFLTSAQAIFQGTYAASERFVPLLAFVCAFTAVAAILNARLVCRVGSWRLVRIGLLVQVGVSLVGVLALRCQSLSLLEFTLIACGNLAAMGLLVPNLTALSLQPFADTAGAAAALFGSVTMLLSAVLGLSIGRSFDGSAGPLLEAYALLGCAALLLVEWRREEPAVSSAAPANVK
ncbi:MAG: multidrug effflux MFS transporter [Denitromonas halophila]|nr:MAG: multidrug effflux MFS transporter [Denitromonas halophila]TVT75723.1 MAG: multidrug effflux MFS transporter [Denitromonas halophila]